ncbi:MAG: type I polyketide synthase, partial [Planctomycetota bacterium]
MPEEVAVVGVGCRFPGGVESLPQLWDLLARGGEAIGEVPGDRWFHPRFHAPQGAPGKTRVNRGGFLKAPIDGFDAAFFGIAPREAEVLDPQQRLLLEVTWEALEHAGVVPSSLRGSRTGVYVGCFSMDHMATQYSPLNQRRLGSHAAKSATLVMLANRISYTLDLRGPSFALDTACSSSLVAVHVACQSIRSGECDQVLVGGVNLMLAPTGWVSLDQGGFLSPSGRCYAFDARAEGYVRGEGVCMLLLKPLEAALRDGDPILTVICATGSNQDGRTPGITLPSLAAQQDLIRDVWSRVPRLRERLALIEAHGTGTRAGDPIEATALGEALAEFEVESPCWLGSIKTNMGHLEGAAGVAGLLKAALCLERRAVVPHLHFEQPNPSIDFDRLGLRVPTAVTSLPQGEEPLYAAVNSFGYGGSNAHAVLRDEPRRSSPGSDQGEATQGPFLFSARTKDALRETVERALVRLETEPAARHLDWAYTAATRRQHFRERVAIVAASPTELTQQLASYLAEGAGAGAGIVQGSLGAEARPAAPVFVYTGMGAQSWGMAGDLLAEDPVVRAAVVRCDSIWQSLAGWSLIRLLEDEGFWAEHGGERGKAMGAPRFAQPGNFALQVGITERWRALGVSPAAIAGHSAGEFAAAWAAGALSLEEALRILFHRSELQQELSGSGTMLAVTGALGAVRTEIGHARDVAVAAFNGPESLVLAGSAEDLREVAEGLEGRDCQLHWLPVDVPYHHPSMARLEGDFRARVGSVESEAPKIPLHSSVTGQLCREPLDLGYWWRNIVEPARFAPVVEALRANDRRGFLEVGPHPALGAAIAQAFAARRERASLAHSLRRGQPGARVLRENLGRLFVQGISVDWSRTFAGGRHVDLPTYPWQRQRLSSESEASRRYFRAPSEDPLLHRQLLTPEPAWHSELRAPLVPYVPDHRVFGRAVFPAAGSLAIGLAVAQAQSRSTELREVRFEAMFPVEEGARCFTALDPATGAFTLHGSGMSDADDGHWSRYATGTIALRPRGLRTQRVDLAAVRGRCTTSIAAKALYANARERGLEYGPAFQVVRSLVAGDRETLAELQLAPGQSAVGYLAHPTLLDGAFQAILALVRDRDTALPIEVRDLRMHAPLGERVWAWGRISSVGAGLAETDIALCDEEGTVLAEVLGLRTRTVPRPRDRSQARLVRTRWERTERRAGQEAPLQTSRWLVVHRAGETADWSLRLVGALGELAEQVVTAAPVAEHAALPEGCHPVDLQDPGSIRRLLEEAGLGGFAGIVYAPSPAAAQPGAPGEKAVLGLLHLVQALAKQEFQRRTHLVVLTQGAHRAIAQDPPTRVGARALWGLGRTIRSEQPNLHCRLIDFDPGQVALDPERPQSFPLGLGPGGGEDTRAYAVGDLKRRETHAAG